MVNVKAGILAAAAVLSLTMPLLAKDKGTETPFPNWGIITVPDGLYMEEGYQPLLTAESYGNDAAAMLERIYPIEPQTYQLVKRDGASFQYGYILRYSANIWEVEAAIDRQREKAGILHSAGVKPNMDVLMERTAALMKQCLPEGFKVVQPMSSKKFRGHVFYECTLQRKLIINETDFAETIHCLAWQHGSSVEIAVLFGYGADGDDSLISVMTDMLKNAEKMPKK